MTRKTEDARIARHRTAIVRDRLSTPMQALVNSGLLNQDSTVLDCGCGQGDDMRALADAGVDVVGWDPHFLPDGEKRSSHAVNLGFVLNVIENPIERSHVLREAYSLANAVLSVAVMLNGKTDVSATKPHADGVLTRRGTFQKYFDQGELRSLLVEALEVDPVAVAPGLFLVFKDEGLEQRFLFHRQQHRLRAGLSILTQSPRPAFPLDKDVLDERHSEIIEALTDSMLDLGRDPLLDDLAPDLAARISLQNISLRRLISISRNRCDREFLNQARNEHANDVVLYYALNVLPRNTSFGKLPDRLRRNVKAHFRTHARTIDAARDLAFGIGNAERIEAAADDAVVSGIGFVEDEDLFVLRSQMDNLKPILRLYIGLAERLAGSFEAAQILKVHQLTGKLTALTYDIFDNTPLPRLRQRIKVDLRQQRTQVFDYGGSNDVQILYLKGRYLPSGAPGAGDQKAFDAALLETRLFDFSGHGPSFREFALSLKRAGYRIEGFQPFENRD